MMNTMLLERTYHSEENLNQTREAALERLVGLLENSSAEYAHLHAENTLESGVELSQLSRLRAAHAAYALTSGGRMRRVSEGAWLHERHVKE